MARKKQRKTGKPLTLESKDTTRPSSSTQFEEQNRGDGEEELEIENSSTSIVDLVAVEKTVNEVSAAGDEPSQSQGGKKGEWGWI